MSWAALRERQSICKTPTGSGEVSAAGAGAAEVDAAADIGAAAGGDPRSGRAVKGVDGASAVAAPQLHNGNTQIATYTLSCSNIVIIIS